MDRSAKTQIFGQHGLPRLRTEKPIPCDPAIVPLDCNHLSLVYQTASLSFPAVWSEKEFAYFLAHENRLCLGLVSDGAAGTRLRAYFLGLLVQGDLDIISIATNPDDRRLGLAEQLLAAVCTHPGVFRAFLEVEVDNVAAIALYSKAGFQVLGRRRAYYGPNRDAFLMRWLRAGLLS